MREFIEFFLAGSTATALISPNAAYWAFDFFFPTESGWDNVTVNCNIHADMTGDHNCNFQNQMISEEIQLIMAFWDTAPPGLAHVKVASFLHISLCGSSPFFELFPTSCRKQLHHAEGILGPPRERNRILQDARKWLGMGCYSSSEWRPCSTANRSRSQGKFDHWGSKASLWFHTLGASHWKNLCCLFAIARIINPGA